MHAKHGLLHQWNFPVGLRLAYEPFVIPPARSQGACYCIYTLAAALAKCSLISDAAAPTQFYEFLFSLSLLASL